MKPSLIAAAVLTLTNGAVCFAYEVPTHSTLSLNAARQSVLMSVETLRQLGLRAYPIGDLRQQFPNYRPEWFSSTEPMSVERLVAFGAAYEDDRGKLQATRHFYNPVNGQALTVFGMTPGMPSPDWALEDIADAGSSQPFSYKKARQYLFQALTLPTEEERKREWGKTFQTLGHVIHHLQDMAQPQHVRNDPHCDALVPCLVPGSAFSLYNPSGYEHWILDNPPASSLYTQYDAVYPAAGDQPFTTPRKFWSTSDGTGTAGSGIAQYTSRGFFSGGTLQGAEVNPAYPEPRLVSTNYVLLDIATICQEAVNAGRPACPSGLNGKMQFYPSSVTDSLRPSQTRENPRALTTSVYDADLVKKNYSPVQSLNRFNHDAAAEFLIPRAVGYSAGMINFFFRGKMEISLPDDGVYGVVDHADPDANTKDTGGFRKLKVKVKNVTPGALGIEAMSAAGKLVLVAKFHRNNCYTPSLAGEYGSPGIDWNACRSKQDEVVVSDEVAAPAAINADGAQLTFAFAQPVPINATDLYLQVVYRGQLGAEADGFAVATKDISEPHYLYNYAKWDQFRYNYYYPVLSVSTTGGTTSTTTPGAHSWEEWCTGGDPAGFPSLAACNDAYGITTVAKYSAATATFPGYDPDNPSPLADPNDPVNTSGDWHKLAYMPPFDPVMTMTSPVGTLTRVAVLTDAQPQNKLLWAYQKRDATHDTGSYQWFWATPATTINQLDEATGMMSSSTTYEAARGVYAPATMAEELRTGDASPMPDLVLVRSVINF